MVKKYKPCKNNKEKKYHGQENTPLGLGYHASGYEKNKKKKGRDGKYYYVIEDKRGCKRWTLRGGGNMGLYPPVCK